MKFAISRIFWIGVALSALLLGIPITLGMKQRRDMAAVQKYIERIQPQLSEDSRFKDVRLLGYSCSRIMYPYIPVAGRVPTQQDWQALHRLILESDPPVFISVKTVTIGPNEEPPRLN